VQIKRFTPVEIPPEKEKKVKKEAKDFKEEKAVISAKADVEETIETIEMPSPESVFEEPATLSQTIPIAQTPDKTFDEIVTDDKIPVAKPAKPAYLLPEEKERLQKLREEELLEKELALEEPDELIDGINPYDVKNIDTPVEQEIVSVRVTQDALDLIPAETLEVAPELQPEPEPEPELHEEEPVKEYTPLFEKPKKKSKKEYKRELNNSALLASLNSKLAEKRKSDKDARKTLTVDTLSAVKPKLEENYKGKAIPSKLNIDYKKQIIADSSVLPSIDLQSKQLEEKELSKKKKRKIRDFILEDIEDDDFEYEPQEQEDSDYDGYDSSSEIWHDLNESHKGLTWRFVLLFVLTAGLAFFTFAHDLGQGNTGLRQYITTQWFNDIKVNYAVAMIYANLVAGVIGMCLCSGVVVRGLKNLFIGKADCDSACAVPVVMTTVMSVAFLVSNESTALFQENKAHVYVVVALAALMFNTLGKIFMIIRAKRNFLFISGDSAKYSAYMPGANEESEVRGFTKGILHGLPVPVFLRKTGFLTDYLKNSYCTDWADLISRKLVPISAVLAVLMGAAAFFLPNSDRSMFRDLTWAVTAGGAFVAVLSPFSIMFLVNNPLLKAAKALSKNDCVVMGYVAAQKFSKANAVVIDASILFPAGSVRFLNVKRCQKPNAINSISIDESIIIAASLAIKSDSIMSSMFCDMISDDRDLLYKIENCIYEVNMGITGWMGAKRVMLGNRAQMKHHGVDVPAEQKERRHCPENADVVYLAVGSETVAMFFIEVMPNSAVKYSLHELEAHDVAVAIKTKDSLVTVNKLADIFELNPEKVRVLPFDQHSGFDEFSRYTSRGSSEIACNGTFTSFVKALITAKSLIRDMMVTSASLFLSVFVAGILGLIFVFASASGVMTAGAVLIYNTVWFAVMLILQSLRRY
jgi:Cu+-exporting ATPase